MDDDPREFNTEEEKNKFYQDLGLNANGEETEVDEEVGHIDENILDGSDNGEQVDALHMSFGCCYMKDDRWQCDEFIIMYTDLKQLDIEEMTEKLIQELTDPTPKRITVCSYQKFIGSIPTTEILSHLKKLVNLLKRMTMHQLCLSSFFFLPEQENLWPQIARLNYQVRKLNMSLNMAPLVLHKILLTSQEDYKALVVKASSFTEVEDDTGLGFTLTNKVVNKIKDWVMKHHKSFDSKVTPVSKLGVSDLIPVDVQFTRGYRGNAKMIQRLKDLGTYDENKTKPEKKVKSLDKAKDKKNNPKKKQAGVQQRKRPRVVQNNAKRGIRHMSNSSRASSGYNSVFSSNQEESYSRRRDSYFYRSGPRRSTAQLEDDLEDVREAKYRMEKDFDRRVDRHKERADRLEKELHHVKDDLMRQERKTMEAEKKINQLACELERSQHNLTEAYAMMKVEWRQRDEEQARQDRFKNRRN